MTPIAVQINELRKSYASHTALDGVSLDVKEGEIFGLIGPDGAGKTTMMRVLCGLLTFGSGDCSVFGFDVERESGEIKKIIGYMPQRFSLYPDLTVAENLRFFSDLFQVDPVNREERLQRLLSFSNLKPFQSRRAEDLSGGMKQKLALSCTLIHTPRLLILDEPTTGVDPVSRREFWDILHELQQEGVTIIVSTPYMDEAGKCDRIAFLHKGRVLATERPAQIARYFPKSLLEVESDTPYDTAARLGEHNAVHSAQLFGDRIHITVDDVNEDFLDSLYAVDPNIKEINVTEPDIEDVFMELMKE
ncbi:MAG: ABC transporter ATP-binding protein [candidate division KSB1 bacterium]|jgi:ABC-2 type transport system ATP-binding protein|nr:ABC transporter ATP-binding protein [candidate division KSB1 bacterium]